MSGPTQASATGTPETEAFDLAAILWRDGRFGAWHRGAERAIAVPNRDGIRQVLPWRWSSVGATARRASDDRPVSKRLRDSVGAAGLITVGALDGSRRVGIESTGSIVDHVAAELDLGPAHGIVLCGPPRSNQKPVVQLHDSLGRTLAFVKVAWNDLTRRLLADERVALEHLADRADGFVSPEVMGGGDFGDSWWLAISPAAPGRRSAPTPESIDRLALAVERTGTEWTGPTSQSTFVATTSADAAGLTHAGPLVAALAERDGDRPFSEAAAHGDFVPWNIQSGRPVPAIWDWERYRRSCPTGYDRVHHRIQVAFHRRRQPFPDALRQVADGLPEILAELPADQRDRHYDWYLVDLLTRYERDVRNHPAPVLPELVAHLDEFLKERLRAS